MPALRYRLRVEKGGKPLDAIEGDKFDFFSWREGEVVTLVIDHKHHVLNIRLDELGNVSLKRHIKARPVPK